MKEYKRELRKKVMAFINHSNKTLFIHNPKCGGVYVRENLTNKYNFLNFANELHHNYSDFFDDKSHIKMQEDTDSHTIRQQGIYRYYRSHQDAKPEYFDKYMVFTFVRNPYEKLFSAYAYLKKMLYNNKNNKIRESIENREYFTDFNVFVKNRDNINNISYFHSFITQYEQLVDASGQILFSYIGKCENIDDDFVEIISIIGFNEIKHLEVLYNECKMNESVSLNINIGKEYNEESFLFVNEYFSKDFDVFGYKKFDTYSEFVQYYTNKPTILKPADKTQLTIHKELQLMQYNNTLQQLMIQDYENIIKYLFEGIQEYAKVPEIVCEVNKLKNETIYLFDKKSEFQKKNKKIYKSLHKYNLDKNKIFIAANVSHCEKCGLVARTAFTLQCHSRCCVSLLLPISHANSL